MYLDSKPLKIITCSLAKLNQGFFPIQPYNRFIEGPKRAVVMLTILAKLCEKFASVGIFFIGSFSLEVSYPKRIYSYKEFRRLAAPRKMRRR